MTGGSTPKPISLDKLIPDGIKPTDHWHFGTNDDTCSRCRKDVPKEDVPLLLWSRNGEALLIYCQTCLGWEKTPEEDEDH